MSRSEHRRIAGTASVLAYSSGSLGTGMFTTVPSVLLLFYCTEVLSIAPAHAGWIVLLPKLWSLLWDPLVGAWSDRTYSRWGRRAPFMAFGALGMALAFVALFSAPSLAPPATALWVGCAYFALTCVYSLYAVPYIAIPAEVPEGSAHAARLISWRMAFVMGGIILGAAGAPVVAAAAGGGRAGYADMSILMAVSCVIAMTPVVIMSRQSGPQARRPESGRKRFWLRPLLATPAFNALAISYAIQMTAVAVISASMPYLVTRTLGRPESDTGLAMLTVLSFTVLAVPLWSWTARRWSARVALAQAAAVYAIAVVLPWLALQLELGWVGFLCALCMVGIGFAGLQVLPFVLMATLVRADAAENEGLLTGVWTASEKIGLALGPFFTAAALDLLDNRLTDLPGFAALVPALLVLFSLIPAFVALRRIA